MPVAERYRRAWSCLKPVSLLRVDGAVRQRGTLGQPCAACAGAELEVGLRGGVELPGCAVRRADERGRFGLFVVTRTSGLSIALSATVKGRRGETVVVDARSARLEPFPFGAREERVVIPVDLGDARDEAAPAAPPPSPAPREELRVPDLSAMSLDQAREALRAKGLGLAVGPMKSTPPTPHLAARVASQRPFAGHAARPGDVVEVTLYAATTAEEYEVPSVVGLPEREAIAKLTQARLGAAIERSAVATSSSQAGRVLAQSPLAGTRVGFATTVRLQVWALAPAAPAPTPVPLPPPAPPQPSVAPPEPPREERESLELAGTWDTGRGIVVRLRSTGPGSYSGTLVRITKPLRAFFWQPGETMMSASRTGPGLYLVAMLVRLGDGRVVDGPEATVRVHGDRADAVNAVWTRVGPP